MATTAPKATKLGPGTLTVGATGSLLEFGSLCSKVTLEPKVDDGETITVLDGGELSDSDVAWSLKGEFYQDYENGMASLIVKVNQAAEAGTQLPFEFRPRNDYALKITGTLTVAPVAIGGDVKKRNTTEFEFKLVGKPTYATATTSTTGT